MEQSSDVNRGALRWVKIGILGAVLLLLFATIIVLGLEVNRKINDQESASSDNIQWTLSQLEVEFLTLENAVIEGSFATSESLDLVRKRFDVFYSRVMMFRSAALYADLRGQLMFSQNLASVQTRLDALIPTIDAEDPVLATGMPLVRSEVSGMHEAVRQIALDGLDHFAIKSDMGRREVWLTLLRVAALTIALVMALVVLSVVLFQLYRVAQRSNEETRASSSRLEAMVSSTLDAVVVVNEHGFIVDFNGAAEQIFGYTRQEAINAPLVDLIIPQEYRLKHLNGMKRHLRDGTTTVVGRGRIQLEAQRKNGEIFPCEFSITRAIGSEGVLFVSFLRDNSAQVAAEQELLKARDEALAGERTKAEFLAVMSHEMRTPLNGMLGTMELMRDTPLADRQRDYLKIMETSGRLLLHHVNDVLDIARLDSGRAEGEKRPFSLDTVLREVIDGQRSVAHANHTVIEMDTSSLGDPMVLGDAQRLRQVLLNLVSNAIKFTRDGVVRVEAEQISDRDIIEFRVTDTGIGISETDLERIFQDFVTLDASYSRSSGGTGLGLGIAKRLVESMQGEIGVESEVGEGSLFWFRLPMPILSSVPLPVDQVEPLYSPSMPEIAALDILVVEDNQINQLVVKEMLTREGHMVTLANDGKEGVATAALRRYDVILMDISMPRMDGVEACRNIRSGDGSSRDTRIIALTAHALPADIERFREAGMNDALVKPISRAALARALSQQPRKEPKPVKEPEVHVELISAENLGQLLEDLGEERVYGLVHKFVEETDVILRDIVDNPDEDDTALIGRIHKLAGSAAMFGTVALSGHLRHLETLGKGGQVPAMRNALPAAWDIWTETREALGEFVPGISAEETVDND